MNPGENKARRKGLGGAELVLAGLVVAVVAMMIVPLPTWLLDILLATNLSVAVVLLLVVLYAPDALAIATFPTILLLTTLFRLALNVSSTRLILLQANAGEVIRAFGYFVVRGNYIVGAIIFLVLTIIQFVVIAKGSERVAEVGARFVLDAMPGKQMAIDAEMRSGTIDGNEARRRRRLLARESQFYGAMDGAMKFVKGDVIASVVITVVNILGGLAIGVGQHDLGATVALKKYGLLTIGDGLVTQIPALVLSTAAGVLVTRVASEEPETPLGEELAGQLFGIPKAIGVAGVLVLLLAAVPGLPTLPFVLLAAGLFVIARARAKAKPPRTETREAFVPVVVPWSVDVPAGTEVATRASLDALRRKLFAETGVPFPPPLVVTSPGDVVLSLFEVPTRTTDLASLPAVVESVLRARAADFLGLGETQRLLDELDAVASATVRNVVPKPVSLALLVDILRRLVEERVSVRDLRAILEALATVAVTEKDALTLTELVRAQLRRATTHRLTRGAAELGVVLVDPTIEDTVRRAVTRTAAGSFLTLAPAAARDVVTALRRAVDEASSASPVILTQPDIRRFVRKLVETDLPHATVVSYLELLPEITLKPLARAHLGGIG